MSLLVEAFAVRGDGNCKTEADCLEKKAAVMISNKKKRLKEEDKCNKLKDNIDLLDKSLTRTIEDYDKLIKVLKKSGDKFKNIQKRENRFYIADKCAKNIVKFLITDGNLDNLKKNKEKYAKFSVINKMDGILAICTKFSKMSKTQLESVLETVDEDYKNFKNNWCSKLELSQCYIRGDDTGTQAFTTSGKTCQNTCCNLRKDIMAKYEPMEYGIWHRISDTYEECPVTSRGKPAGMGRCRNIGSGGNDIPEHCASYCEKKDDCDGFVLRSTPAFTSGNCYISKFSESGKKNPREWRQLRKTHKSGARPDERWCQGEGTDTCYGYKKKRYSKKYNDAIKKYDIETNGPELRKHFERTSTEDKIINDKIVEQYTRDINKCMKACKERRSCKGILIHNKVNDHGEHCSVYTDDLNDKLYKKSAGESNEKYHTRYRRLYPEINKKNAKNAFRRVSHACSFGSYKSLDGKHTEGECFKKCLDTDECIGVSMKGGNCTLASRFMRKSNNNNLRCDKNCKNYAKSHAGMNMSNIRCDYI